MAKQKQQIQEKRGRGRPATGLTPQRPIRVSDDEWAIYVGLAESAGVTVSEWVRNVLRAEAKRSARRAG